MRPIHTEFERGTPCQGPHHQIPLPGPLVVLLLILASGAGLIGCAADRVDRIEAHASERFAAQSMEDWRSFSDALIVVRATRERRLESPIGTPSIGREIHFQVVERLFVRDGVEVPTSVTWTVDGWHVVEAGSEVEVVTSGATRIELGQIYLVPVLQEFRDGEPVGWSPLSLDATIAVVDGRLNLEDRREPSEFISSLDGLSVSETTARYRASSMIDGLGPVESEPALSRLQFYWRLPAVQSRD